MRIFLTIDLRVGLFSNGMNQNIITLQDLLVDMGHEVSLIAEYDPRKDKKSAINRDLLEERNIFSIDEVVKERMKMETLIQCGVTYGDFWVNQMRQSSPYLKNIHVAYGPRLFLDMEFCVHGSESGEAGRYKNVDEVWTSPHYDYSLEYYKLWYRTENVKILPYIWSSNLAEKKEKLRNEEGLSCHYKPGKPVNIAIMEPNNIVKNSVCPALIAEGLYNKNPSAINEVYVWGGQDHSRENYYEKFMLNLDLAQDYKIFFEPRTPFPQIFSKRCNYLVSHQHMNALNYTYLEAFYFGIPLIHNSEFIKNEAGYYYEGFRLKDGVSALEEAIASHDDRIEEYKKEGEKIIWKYHPKNPEVKKAYEEIL